MSLHLDARQRAMLAEMGIEVWQPKPAAPTPLAAEKPGALSHARRAPTPTAPHPVAESTGSAATAAPHPAAQITPPVPAPAPAAPPVAPAIHATPASPAALAAPPVQAEVSSQPAQNISANAPILATDGIEHVDTAPTVTRVDALARQALQHLAPPGSANAPGSQVVRGMDWATLRETVSGCRACGLCEGRTQTVFGAGAERANWMVVGEAPGEQEDLHGEPFVGPAGQLLDAMLRAVGVNRQAPAGEQAVFIANVLKCRPPGNRNPAPDEVAQCEPYLRRQVELVQPKIILALGRFAVQALLNTNEPIGRLRQQVHQYQGVPVIVSYHPAYLLRNLPDKAKAWADLVLAMQVAKAASASAPQA